jgi:hypothetical protein
MRASAAVTPPAACKRRDAASEARVPVSATPPRRCSGGRMRRDASRRAARRRRIARTALRHRGQLLDRAGACRDRATPRLPPERQKTLEAPRQSSTDPVSSALELSPWLETGGSVKPNMVGILGDRMKAPRQQLWVSSRHGNCSSRVAQLSPPFTLRRSWRGRRGPRRGFCRRSDPGDRARRGWRRRRPQSDRPRWARRYQREGLRPVVVSRATEGLSRGPPIPLPRYPASAAWKQRPAIRGAARSRSRVARRAASCAARRSGR